MNPHTTPDSRCLLDYHRVKASGQQTITSVYGVRDTILYALGLGMGSDPRDEDELRFVYEKDLRVLPTMAGVLGYPGLWLSEVSLGIDWVKLVHAGQSMVFHASIPPAGKVVGTNRVTAIVDKGPGRGALVITERALTDASTGTLLATLEHVAFARADGGFSRSGQPSDPAPAVRPDVPDKPADLSLPFPTRPDAALLYRLSGDMTAFHADPALARAAGFERPILHGMATFGIAARALLKACCGQDPARLRSISGRFSAPVLPGETITVDIWPGKAGPSGCAVQFQARAGSPSRRVLQRGWAEIAE